MSPLFLLRHEEHNRANNKRNSHDSADHGAYDNSSLAGVLGARLVLQNEARGTLSALVRRSACGTVVHLALEATAVGELEPVLNITYFVVAEVTIGRGGLGAWGQAGR